MSQYMITLVGYVKEATRPENFPDVVSDWVMVKVNDAQSLRMEVVKFHAIQIRMQGMLVMLPEDEAKPANPDRIDVNRRFVPMHVLSHIDSFVTPIAGEETQVDNFGITFHPSGKPVMVN